MTHTRSTFANPYLVCAQCDGRVVGRPDGRNEPCGHRAPFESECLSWSPVSGCLCLEVFGERDHPVRAR